MKITATFDSFEEFIAFANGSGEKNLIEVITGGAQAPQEAPKKTEAKKATPKKKEEAPEAPAEAPKQEEEPVQAPEAPAQPSVDRVALRKLLANLNKKTGENTASKLIKEFGVDKFTDMKDEDLPALMQKAEEALNA